MWFLPVSRPLRSSIGFCPWFETCALEGTCGWAVSTQVSASLVIQVRPTMLCWRHVVNCIVFLAKGVFGIANVFISLVFTQRESFSNGLCGNECSGSTFYRNLHHRELLVLAFACIPNVSATWGNFLMGIVHIIEGLFSYWSSPNNPFWKHSVDSSSLFSKLNFFINPFYLYLFFRESNFVKAEVLKALWMMLLFSKYIFSIC